MQRRPWPLVFLALLQILGPIGSIFISAHVNKVGFFDMAGAIWKYSHPWDLIEFYALPFAQGIFIFYAKRFGYYAVLALAAFSFYLNIQEWRIASDVISLPILLGVTGTNLALIVYLLLPNVRAVFMNPRLRWWETPPRYVVSMKAQVSKEDGHAKPATIGDLSIGGAGIQVESELYQQGDTLLLTFEHDSTTILMRAVAVYGRPDPNGGHRYGLEWQRGAAEDERRTMRLLDELEEKKTPVIRMPPKWKEDLTAWWNRARKSPSAWVPEVPKKK
jgi:hypothetical protein